GSQALQGNWSNAWANLKHVARGAWNGLVALTTEYLPKWGAAIWGWLRDNAPHWVQTLMDWTEAGWRFIQGVGAVVMSIGSIFQPIWDAIAQFVTWKDVILGTALALAITFAPAIIAAIGAALAPLGGFIAAWAPLLALIAACIAAVVLMRAAWEND